MVVRGRLGEPSSGPDEGERFEQLVAVGGVVVEQILSAASDVPVAHRQQHDEWVVVLAGGAELEVGDERCELGPGDWALLPAGVPHTVVRTDAATSWLAVHVRPAP